MMSEACGMFLSGSWTAVRTASRLRRAFSSKCSVKLIGDGTQERSNAAFFVGDIEVGGGDDRRLFATGFEQVNEDANEVAGFLRLRGDEHLVFEQAHQHGRVGPRFDKFGRVSLHVARAESPRGGDVLQHAA